MSLSRSSMALQFCIEELLRRANEPCGFYLITIPELMSWKEVGMRHRYMLNLMSLDASRRKLKRFGGVRVFEEGEKTHRPHAHWVMSPRMAQVTIQHYANRAGMGHVWLDPRFASPHLGMYLSKYLSKNRGSLKGVRRWSCFGEFSSVKVHDVTVTSPEIELFRSHFAACKEKGLQGTQAYTEAVRLCNLSKYGHQFNDSTQGASPVASQAPQPVELTKTTVIWND